MLEHEGTTGSDELSDVVPASGSAHAKLQLANKVQPTTAVRREAE